MLNKFCWDTTCEEHYQRLQRDGITTPKDEELQKELFVLLNDAMLAFSGVTTDHQARTEEVFMHFPIGTPVFFIYGWFAERGLYQGLRDPKVVRGCWQCMNQAHFMLFAEAYEYLEALDEQAYEQLLSAARKLCLATSKVTNGIGSLLAYEKRLLLAPAVATLLHDAAADGQAVFTTLVYLSQRERALQSAIATILAQDLVLPLYTSWIVRGPMNEHWSYVELLSEFAYWIGAYVDSYTWILARPIGRHRT